jgi:hypothetical protein
MTTLRQLLGGFVSHVFRPYATPNRGESVKHYRADTTFIGLILIRS